MQREIQDFKEAYKFPLRWDNTCVWTADNNMALNFLNPIISDNPVKIREATQVKIVNAINGFDSDLEPFDLSYDEDQGMIKLGDKDFLLIRGWGHLTGGLRLDDETAIKLQDDFAAHIINCLTNKELINS